jgi:hypothetical protein
MSRRFQQISGGDRTLDFDRAPDLSGGGPRCSLEVAAWRAVAVLEAAVIVVLLGVIALS